MGLQDAQLNLLLLAHDFESVDLPFEEADFSDVLERIRVVAGRQVRPQV